MWSLGHGAFLLTCVAAGAAGSIDDSDAGRDQGVPRQAGASAAADRQDEEHRAVL